MYLGSTFGITSARNEYIFIRIIMRTSKSIEPESSDWFALSSQKLCTILEWHILLRLAIVTNGIKTLQKVVVGAA